MDIVEKTYDIKGACELIGCSEWLLRKMVRESKIPYYKIGNRIRFTDVTLSKWMLKQEDKNYKYGS